MSDVKTVEGQQEFVSPAADGGESQRLLKQALLWLGSTTIVFQICSWFFTLLTVRFLAPSDYGVLALAETAFSYLGLVTNLGISAWVVQRRSLSRDEQESAFALSVILGLACSILLFVVAPRLAEFYHTQQLVWVLRFLAPVFLLEGLAAVPKGVMRREMRFKSLGLMNLWLGLARAVLQLALAWLGYGYLALVAGILLLHTGDALFALLLQPVRLRLAIRLAPLREALRFGVPVAGAAICHTIFSTADNVVVGRLFGAHILGFYAMAFYLTDLPMSKINLVLRPVALAHLSRLQHSLPELRREFLKLTQGAFFITMPILVGLLLVSAEVVPVLLGDRWRPMVPMLQMLCVVGLLRAAGDTVSPLLLAVGQPRKEFKLNLLSALILPPAFYVLARLLGLAGIYLTWLCIFPGLVIYALSLGRAAAGVRLRDFCANALMPIAAAIIMILAVQAAVGFFPGGSEALLLTVKAASGALVYVVILLIFRRRGLLFRPGALTPGELCRAG